MQYYSLNHQAPNVNFEAATIKGQAPDKGLYFPETIPLLPDGFIKKITSLSKEEIGYTVMRPYVGDCIPEDLLRQIVSETIKFPFPLTPVSENIFSLELFHGPTLAFKDVGARFMSRCLGYFNRNAEHHTTVLVATSGDTGGAVANGFLGVPGVEVIILYPSGKVSAVQELQLTTCGQNIRALEIIGSFDDCQAMVKQAFMDEELNHKLSLTSANSINVARWLPQQLYYFYAYQQWKQVQPPVFAVPSGNFGNICAGIIAYASGLPAQHFIAACNANDTVPRFFDTGNYIPQPSIATISNAMDVGNPSNFIRIMEIFGQQIRNLKSMVSTQTIDDATTAATIKAVYEKHHYTLDPHGAVAYFALEQYLLANPHLHGIILETAHPVKFPETVEEATGTKIKLPSGVEHLLKKEKKSILMNADFDSLKQWLMVQ